MTNLKELRRKAEAIKSPYNGKWFFCPEKHGLRANGSEYVLDADICYGTEGDPHDSFSLYESYDLDTYRFIAAASPDVILDLIARLEGMEGALRWYAAGENCYQGPIGIGEGKMGMPFGTTAREALKQFGSEREG